MNTCKNCRWFNWKLSGSAHWGECTNPAVLAATRLSLKLVNLDKAALDETRTYTRIHFDEEKFGCGYFQSEEAHSPILPLMAELRQALLDNAPHPWHAYGELYTLTEQMKTDEAVLRVAIHFVIGTGKFIRQER